MGALVRGASGLGIFAQGGPLRERRFPRPGGNIETDPRGFIESGFLLLRPLQIPNSPV